MNTNANLLDGKMYITDHGIFSGYLKIDSDNNLKKLSSWKLNKNTAFGITIESRQNQGKTIKKN